MVRGHPVSPEGVTAFLLHPSAPLHDTGWGHPEHQGRMRSLASTVGKDMLSLHGRVLQLEAEAADPGVYELVHTRAHVERVRLAVEQAAAGDSILPMDSDTRVSGASWEAVTGSTGAVLRALRGIADGEFRRAFVATRPPGHHATPDGVMGFCLFNHVAVAARWLQREGLAERVLIVDWDVHHGNGTQDIFQDDPTVFFCSLHQAGHWPGTGKASETGAGRGTGFTLNVPVDPGVSRSEYLRLFEGAMQRVREHFTPDWILVSSGFDAMAGDPLGNLPLEPEDFHRMTRLLVEWAEEACDGRVVALLEGGYNPVRTGQGAVAVIRGLCGVEAPTFPAAAPARQEEW
jgi:acetoin utilization deacetylase AcuC-like enzyme